MKKRLFIWVLVLCMVCTMLPFGAFAAETETSTETNEPEATASPEPVETTEPEAARISITDSVAGSDIIVTAALTGSERGGTVVFGHYDSTGRQKQVRRFAADENVTASFSGAAVGDSVKVFWLDEASRPMCPAAEQTWAASAKNYSPELDEAHIDSAVFNVGDETAEQMFVDNQLILTTEPGADKAQLLALVAEFGGTVVGEIDMLDELVVEFPEAMPADALKSLAAAMSQRDLVASAEPNYVFEFRPDSMPYYPNDTWGGQAFADGHPTENIFNEGYPAGNNWGLEAINVPSAWRMLQENGKSGNLSKISVGVLDSMFDLNHSDVRFKDAWGFSKSDYVYTEHTAAFARNETDKELYNSIYSHGTHVAGIIAAKTGNSSGISGIAYGVDLYGLSLIGKDAKYVPKQKSAVDSLMTKLFSQTGKNKLIINYSMEDGIWKTSATDMLKKFLDDGKDFLIVTAAGNDADKDAAKNSGFNKITDPDLKARILVVGAAKLGTGADGNVQFSFVDKETKDDGSTVNMNWGTRIDLAAPGENIYSTVPKNVKGLADSAEGYECQKKTGTSQAAPHVTGVAALVWAADPTLTGAEVKTALTKAATISLSNTDATGNSHKMLDAAKAVADTLKVENSLEGVCGVNACWKLDTETGTLTVYKAPTASAGAMKNFDDTLCDVPWYRYRQQITTVKVESGVDVVGDYAFVNCPNLKRAELGSSVRRIGDEAFIGCKKLETVSILPETLTEIGRGAFHGTALNEIYFSGDPFTVTAADQGEAASFPRYVTLYYSPDNSVWPTQITNSKWQGYTAKLKDRCMNWEMDEDGTLRIWGWGPMPDYTLYDHYYSDPPWRNYKSSIKAVEIYGLSSIGLHAFYDYNKLTKTTISGSMMHIGDYAFYKCSSMTSITIPDGLTTIGNYAFGVCTSLTSITVPDSVTSIGKFAFGHCASLTSIKIPDGVTSIERSAFFYCESLTSIIIPASVTSIGEAAFSGCKSLTNIEIPDGVTSIDEYTFNYCSSLTSVIIPDGVTSIGVSAFYGCSSLISITIPDGVTSIGDSAFRDCSSLTSIKIPKGVTSIGAYTFYKCSGLISINVPEDVTSIGKSAFDQCTSLTSITIPEGVTSIGEYAFSYCSSLTNITIPESVTSIEYGVFIECSSLTSITIPDSVTSFGTNAFQKCKSLTSITLPKSLTSIGSCAFDACINLKTIWFRSASLPSASYYSFQGVTATAYYPSSWGEAPTSSYGGTITWIPYDPA